MHTPYTLLLTKFFLSLFFISCTQQADTLQTYEQEKVMMGTVMKIKAVAEGDEEKNTRKAFDAAFHEIAKLESELSEWQPSSPVSEVNRNAGIERVQVPEAVVKVTEKALEIAEITGGAFDVTFKPVGRLWNVKERTSPPPADSIQATLNLADYKNIELDKPDSTLFLRKAGMAIGGLAASRKAMQPTMLAKCSNSTVSQTTSSMSGAISMLKEKKASSTGHQE